MSRTLSTNTGAAVVGDVTKPGYLIEVKFPDPVAPFRASSRGDVEWDGKFWRKFGFSINGLASDTSRVSLEGQAVFTDPDNELGALVRGFGIGDREINIYVFYDDVTPDTDDPVHLGRMRGGDFDEDCDTCVVALSFMLDSISTLYCPRTYLTPENGFKHLAPAGMTLDWKNQTVTFAAGTEPEKVKAVIPWIQGWWTSA